MDIKTKSYVYGIIGADGNLYLQDRNRGRITLEVAVRDIDIVEKLYGVIPNSNIRFRDRSTNYKQNYQSAVFSNHRIEFRQEMIDFGLPLMNKSGTLSVPIGDYSEPDFWRGLIDGNGSVGLTAQGEPIISLVITSDNIYHHYCKLLNDNFGIVKNVNRNKRDNVYNVALKHESAIVLCEYLYGDATIYLNRKYNKYLEIKGWERTRKKVNTRSWKDDEVKHILTHTVKESAKFLNRTESSIKNKLFKVTNNLV